MNQFGDLIKHLREQSGLIQRQIANLLSIDTPMLSKIERGVRSAKRRHVAQLSKIFNVPEEDLLSLWLADKIYDVVKDENVAIKAIQVAKQELETNLITKRIKNTTNR